MIIEYCFTKSIWPNENKEPAKLDKYFANGIECQLFHVKLKVSKSQQNRYIQKFWGSKRPILLRTSSFLKSG